MSCLRRLHRNALLLSFPCWKVLLLFGLASLLPGSARGQSSPNFAEHRRGRVRVVHELSVKVDSALVERIIELVDHRGPPAGLPEDFPDPSLVTVSLVPDVPPGTDGSAIPIESIIVLPVLGVTQSWSAEHLARVVAHEMVHVDVGRFTDYAPLAFWFSEGFAEHSIGGLTCRGDALVRTTLMMASDPDGIPELDLRLASINNASRLRYDLFGIALDYLAGAFGEGAPVAILERVRVVGFERAFAEVIGLDESKFEEGWRRFVWQEYRNMSAPLECPPQEN